MDRGSTAVPSDGACPDRAVPLYAVLRGAPEEPPHLPYHIIWYPDTREHFRHLTARQRSIVFDSVEEQLVNEPTAETRSRKEMRPNSLASWELRIGDLRVYYDITEEPQTVIVVAVGIKRGSRIFIGGEERQL